MSETIDLAEVDDVRDVVHRAVACLAQGQAALLPTESGAALTASALHPAAIARCARTAAAWPRPTRPVVLLRGGAEASDWAAGLSPLESKLIARAWPGSLTLVKPLEPGRGLFDRLDADVRAAIARDGAIGLNAPDGLLREVVRLSPGPVVRFDAPGGVVVNDADLEVVDATPPHASGRPTAVIVESGRCRVLDPGGISEADLAAMSGTIWLFVCTGNTCRSPMAEALCKVMLAKKIGCAAEKLVERGYVVHSAGIAATDGRPAAAHAVEVVARRGGSLKTHASRRASVRMLRDADLILTLSGEHLDVVLEIAPDLAAKARMLHPEGLDIADPIGSDQATYQETAREIERCLSDLIARHVTA